MAEYRINEIATLSGVSVRNIRVYQDRGLLPAPKLKGRTGWYAEEHLTRLQLISGMLDRGYNFATISELLLAAREDLKVEHLLYGRTKPSRWTTFRRAAKITVGELRKSLGSGATDQNLARSERLGLFVKEGKDVIINFPELLECAEVLLEAGVDFEDLLHTWEGVRGDFDDIASRFAGLVADKYLAEEHADEELTEAQFAEATDLIKLLRPLSHHIAQVAFTEALDKQISAALARAAQKLTKEQSHGQNK